MIEVDDVSKSYRAESGMVRALAPTTLRAARGEAVAITGPSGSGKSTLLAIAGLLLRPDTGHVRIDGEPAPDAEAERARFRRENLGFIFQAFNLFDHLTAVENVLAGFGDRSRPCPSLRQAAMQALARVGLDDRAQHAPAELSGGEQQRVAIARALVKRPRVLLADEPTGNLDEENSALVCDLLLSATEETTVLLVTHDASVASRCDRVVTPGIATGA